jgi:membrane metallo-endopeptidase-like protein 1
MCSLLYQIDDDERVIVDEPGYLVNLTRLLPATPPRTLANYMMWRAARASLDYFTEAARKIQLEFAKNITGKKSGTERWKTCTGGYREKGMHGLGGLGGCRNVGV